MQPKNTSSREVGAQKLLTSGAVNLYVGQRYALVQGMSGKVYRVTKDGCTCPDRQRRGQTCKHEIACRQLCEEFKACKAAAQRGETIRPSRHLLQAIRWSAKVTQGIRGNSAGCRDCGRPTSQSLCSDCLFGQRGAA